MATVPPLGGPAAPPSLPRRPAEADGDAPESDDDEEMPLNARMRPAALARRNPKRPPVGPRWDTLLGAPLPAVHATPKVSWREEIRLLHRVLFQPVAPEKRLAERDAFGRNDVERLHAQESLLACQQRAGSSSSR